MTATEQSKKNIPFALRAIYFRNCELKMADDFDPLIPGQELIGLYRADSRAVRVRTDTKIADNSVRRACSFISRFEFRYDKANSSSVNERDPEDDSGLFAKITAEITADYIVLGEDIPDQVSLHRWATTSALIHCWPYWREFAHSSMARMNLPLTVVPMVDIQAMIDGGQKPQPSDAPSKAENVLKSPPKKKSTSK